MLWFAVGILRSSCCSATPKKLERTSVFGTSHNNHVFPYLLVNGYHKGSGQTPVTLSCSIWGPYMFLRSRKKQACAERGRLGDSDDWATRLRTGLCVLEKNKELSGCEVLACVGITRMFRASCTSDRKTSFTSPSLRKLTSLI